MADSRRLAGVSGPGTISLIDSVSGAGAISLVDGIPEIDTTSWVGSISVRVRGSCRIL